MLYTSLCYLIEVKMSKTGYGDWKGPFRDAVKGRDYIDPCPPGTYLVRGYRRRSDGAEVPAYCKKMR